MAPFTLAKLTKPATRCSRRSTTASPSPRRPSPRASTARAPPRAQACCPLSAPRLRLSPPRPHPPQGSSGSQLPRRRPPRGQRPRGGSRGAKSGSPSFSWRAVLRPFRNAAPRAERAAPHLTEPAALLLPQVGTPYLRDKADKAYTALSGGQAAQLGLLSADDEVGQSASRGPAAAPAFVSFRAPAAWLRDAPACAPATRAGRRRRPRRGRRGAQRRRREHARGPRAEPAVPRAEGAGREGGRGGVSAGDGAGGQLALCPRVRKELPGTSCRSFLLMLTDKPRLLCLARVAYLVGRASVHSPGLRRAGLRCAGKIQRGTPRSRPAARCLTSLEEYSPQMRRVARASPQDVSAAAERALARRAAAAASAGPLRVRRRPRSPHASLHSPRPPQHRPAASRLSRARPPSPPPQPPGGRPAVLVGRLGPQPPDARRRRHRVQAPGVVVLDGGEARGPGGGAPGPAAPGPAAAGRGRGAAAQGPAAVPAVPAREDQPRRPRLQRCASSAPRARFRRRPRALVRVPGRPSCRVDWWATLNSYSARVLQGTYSATRACSTTCSGHPAAPSRASPRGRTPSGGSSRCSSPAPAAVFVVIIVGISSAQPAAGSNNEDSRTAAILCASRMS